MVKACRQGICQPGQTLTAYLYVAHAHALGDTACMSSVNSQQVFNFNLVSANTFETFYARDSVFIDLLKSIATRDHSEKQVFIWGPEGTGKTHLLQAICHAAQNADQRSMYVPLAKCLTHEASFLEDLNMLDILCIDDIHLVAGKSEWETALFNLINQIRVSDSTIVIASENSTAENIFELPDLNSRSVWGPVYKLPRVSDDELGDVMSMHARKSGLVVSDEVKNFLLARYQRDLPKLVQALEKLSHASLQEQRKVTIPFVKKVLAIN
jgi:DnaA family protein